VKRHETLSLPLKFDGEGNILGVKWGPEVCGWHDVPQVEPDVHQNGTDEHKAGTVQRSQEKTIRQVNVTENEAGAGTPNTPNNQCEVGEVAQDLNAPLMKEEGLLTSEVVKQSKLHPEYSRPLFQECFEQQKSQLPAESGNISVSDISSSSRSPNDGWDTWYDAPPPPTSITQYRAAKNLGAIHLYPGMDTGLTGFETTKLQIS
jgi:hypothetical protein